MLLKNGNAAEKMKTRNAAATQSSKIKTRLFPRRTFSIQQTPWQLGCKIKSDAAAPHSKTYKRKAAVAFGPPL
jgi:hypothetical protein